MTVKLQNTRDRQTHRPTERADGAEACLLSEWEFDAEEGRDISGKMASGPETSSADCFQHTDRLGESVEANGIRAIWRFPGREIQLTL